MISGQFTNTGHGVSWMCSVRHYSQNFILPATDRILSGVPCIARGTKQKAPMLQRL